MQHDFTNRINSSPLFFGSEDQNPKQSDSSLAEKSGHAYLLIKNLPPQIDEQVVRELIPEARDSSDILILENTSNVYIKFPKTEIVRKIVEVYENTPIEFNGKPLRMCLVTKLPLDLNQKSRILLVTIYNEQFEVNVHSLYEIFRNFGSIRKMIVFKKKNYQSFIEFETANDASHFKQSLHNINYKGLFYLKIQFTQKSSLIVQVNNLYECDFTREPTQVPLSHTAFDYSRQLPQTASINANIVTNNTIINNNVITSLGKFTFSDFAHQQQSGHKFANKPSDCSPFARLGKVTESKNSSPEPAEQEERLYPLKATNLTEEAKHKMFFNLFSLYGNIDRITIDSFSGSAMIYFLSEFDQITAYHHLNGIEFFGKTLSLDLLKSELPTPPANVALADISNTVYYRKNKETPLIDFHSKQKTINKPSRTLYVFNLSKNVTLQVVKDLFEKFEHLVELYYLNESKNSALCTFESSQAAIRILCLFKNMNLVDKSLKINFANENLAKDNERERERRRQMALFVSVPVLGQNNCRPLGTRCSPEKPYGQFQAPESFLTLKSSSSNKFRDLFQHSGNTFEGKSSNFSLFGHNPILEEF
jgi:RNA recognition motif-containing protein